ncbi:MAG: helix-turn-helix domain-containing GNAT family N-acetyltransferase [Sphingobium sp.]
MTVEPTLDAHPEPADAVIALRAFNRFHTRFSGVLQPDYLESGLGLTAARLLYEIAQAGDGVLASVLRDRLGLDAGHASRTLASFERRGWIRRSRAADARQRPITLTDAGRAFFDAMDARTRADTERRIAGLDSGQRADLTAALARARLLLGDGLAWSIRPFRTGDLALVAARQTLLYEREYGWGRAMELLQGEIASAFLRDFKPGREQCWIAEADGAMLGAVLLTDASCNVGQLRLLHVEREARGLGIGRALVDQCIGFAGKAGYDRLKLWTQDILTGARRIYEAAGFIRTASEAHNIFGARMNGETWERPLP